MEKKLKGTRKAETVQTTKVCAALEIIDAIRKAFPSASPVRRATLKNISPKVKLL